MQRVDRRGVLCGLGALALGGCAAPQRISEGDGKKAPQGGIGGTGIVGTLTDFGSLIVNGLVLETSSRTRVTDAFGARDQAALAIGQSLTVEAERTPLFGSETSDAIYEAIRVQITHPVIGAVEKVDPTGSNAIVAGVRVTLEPGALGRFVPGVRMAISGLWQGPRVIASRVEPAEATGADVIAGEIAVVQSLPSLGGRPLFGASADLPEPGTFVTAYGRNKSDGFAIERLVPGRFFGAAGALVTLSIEGYLEPIQEDPRFAISGLGHSFDEFAQLQKLSGERAVFRGAYDGAFVVEEGLVLPANFQNRRRLLADVQTGRATGRVVGTRV